MKCPSCNAKLSWADRCHNPDTNECYQCQTCQMISTPKHGLSFFIIFFMICAPIIEIIIRLTTMVGTPIIEIIIRIATEGLYYSGFEGIQIYGLHLPGIPSYTITFTIMLLAFLKLNRLIPIEKAN